VNHWVQQDAPKTVNAMFLAWLAEEPVHEAGGRQLRYRGRDRNRAWFKMTAAVCNLSILYDLDP
jgi:hypothetical protein